MRSPARLITASKPSRRALSSLPAAGSHSTSALPGAGTRRTSRLTVWPAPKSDSTSAEPIRPEDPAISTFRPTSPARRRARTLQQQQQDDRAQERRRDAEEPAEDGDRKKPGDDPAD